MSDVELENVTTDEVAETETEDTYTPPTREEYEKLIKASARARNEAKERRLLLEKHGIDPKTGDKATDPDMKAAIEQANKTHKIAVKAMIRASLQGAGASAANTKLLMGLVDTTSVEITDDGEITGIEEQLAEIRKEYDHLFVATKPKRPQHEGLGRKEPAKKETSYSDRLLGRG